MMLAALLLLGAFQQAVQDSQCIKCHEDQAAEVKDTMHERMGVGCVSCHGTDEIVNEKHKRLPTFRAARLPEVAELCGSCHKAVFDAFKPSDHFAAASKDDGEPKHRSSCSACHEYHTTSGAFPPTILKLCLNCHEENSHEYKEGVEALAALGVQGKALRELEDHLDSLARAPGVSIFDLATAAEDGKSAQTRLRIAQHGLDWKRLKAEAAVSADRAAAAYNTLAERERRFGQRYFGLGVFLALLGLSATLVALRARRLRKESGS